MRNDDNLIDILVLRSRRTKSRFVKWIVRFCQDLGVSQVSFMVSIGNGNSLYRLLDEGNGRKTRPMLAAESTSEILPSDAGRGKRLGKINNRGWNSLQKLFRTPWFTVCLEYADLEVSLDWRKAYRRGISWLWNDCC